MAPWWCRAGTIALSAAVWKMNVGIEGRAVQIIAGVGPTSTLTGPNAAAPCPSMHGAEACSPVCMQPLQRGDGMPGAGGQQACAIDFGGIVDAIWVGSGAALGFYNITVRNMGTRSGSRLASHAAYEPDFFGFWPSVTVSPGAEASWLPYPPLLLLCPACMHACMQHAAQ